MGEPRYFVEPDDDAESPYAALVIDRDGIPGYPDETLVIACCYRESDATAVVAALNGKVGWEMSEVMTPDRERALVEAK